MLSAAFDPTLLSRIEDAGINASAPPQQRWLDGWLLRFSPGKAKRARCINAVALGRLSVAAKLALCEPAFAEAGLPLLMRITPFSQPADLDDMLARRGLQRIDDTRVMVLERLADAPAQAAVATTDSAARDAVHVERIGHAGFAQVVGQLRGSPLAQRQAHAERLERAPVPFEGFIMKDDDGRVLACGQFAVEAELVGLYDVFTAPDQRGRGLAGTLCRHVLARARERGARVAYLQVESDNHAARRVYQRIGFADAYAYHYRGTAEAAG